MLVLFAGIFFTLASGLFPFRKIGFIIKNTFGKIRGDKSAFSATATALGATVGTGNIIGVASAIAIGGPGAVFWMWVGAFFGMMLKFTEAALAVKYSGGAALYIEKAFNQKSISILWCVCCMISSFFGGNMIQTHAASSVFSVALGFPKAVIGGTIALLCGAVLFCGTKSVIKTSSFLVPFMALFYVFGCFAALYICRKNILPALGSIFSSALDSISLGGGLSGILVSNTLREGIAKGTFTHEAGMGSAAFAHSESGEKDPVAQGCWGIVEVFIDTIFVCTLTALVILSSGKTFTETSVTDIFSGCFGFSGKIFLSVSMYLFALAAVIGWAFYGQKALNYITNSIFLTNLYKITFCFASLAGSFIEIPVIWSLTDIFNGLMIFPNLAALFILSPKIIKMIKKCPA